ASTSSWRSPARSPTRATPRTSPAIPTRTTTRCTAASSSGPFASVDAGSVLAYDGCSVTPFISGWGYVSKPLDARPVDASEPQFAPGTYVDTPETTVGVQVRIGLKLNLSSCERKDKAIVAGFGFDHLWDNDSDRGLASG